MTRPASEAAARAPMKPEKGEESAHSGRQESTTRSRVDYFYDEAIGKLTISNPTPYFIVMTREALIGTSWNGGAPIIPRELERL